MPRSIYAAQEKLGEIGSRTHDIESSLERFQIKHDDSVRSFYAYISAPSSSDLLREHGFVGFDASGNRPYGTESIDALACPGFVAIRRAGETARAAWDSFVTKTGGPRRVPGCRPRGVRGGGGSYYEQVASRVNVVCGQRVGEFVTQVSERIDRFVEEVKEERSRLAHLRGQIWKARAALVGRFAVVVVLLSMAVFALAKGAPSHFAYLLWMLSDRLFEAVLVGRAVDARRLGIGVRGFRGEERNPTPGATIGVAGEIGVGRQAQGTLPQR